MKKKLNFTEKIAIAIVIFSCFCIAANYALAFMNRTEINESVTISLIGTVVGAFIGLAVKSLGEKMSANNHGINLKTGLPYGKEEEADGEQDYTETDEP